MESSSRSSVKQQNSKLSLKRRIAIDDDPPETTTKRRRFTAELKEEMEPSSSVQNSVPSPTNITSIDNLPPEILEAVLQRSSTEDLLNFRLVNRKWNQLSSRTLRYRSDNVLCFQFVEGHFIKVTYYDFLDDKYLDVSDSKTLHDLVDCMKCAKHFPYSYFDFWDLKDFGNGDFNDFLSIWGHHIVSLKIKIYFDPINGVEALRKLLLEQVPNLKKLEIIFGQNRFDIASTSSIQLFSDSMKFQMPKLQFLVVNKRYRQFRGIVDNILSAACNLREFEVSCNDCIRLINRSCVWNTITIDDLQKLQLLNRLHCLKKIEILLSDDLMKYWRKFSKILNLKLESLHVSFMYDEIRKNQEYKLAATSIMNQLLESNKDVVELAIDPVGLLPGVVFPQFQKLQKLKLWGMCTGLFGNSMFPASIEMANIFPNLKELDLHLQCVDDYFPLAPITAITSVEVLHLWKCEPSASKLLKMTPNVKHVYLTSFCSGPRRCHGHGQAKMCKNGFRAVLSNLTKLETMKWTISGMAYKKSLFTLDEAVTGFSRKFCKKMSKKFRNQDRLSAVELASIEQLRKHPSITDLKDLKRLDIHCIYKCDNWDCEDSECEGICQNYTEVRKNEDEAGFTNENRFFMTGFTKVSHFLGFHLMPNLKINMKTTYID